MADIELVAKKIGEFAAQSDCLQKGAAIPSQPASEPSLWFLRLTSFEPDFEDMEGEKDHLPSKDLMFDPWATLSEEALELHAGDVLRQVYRAMLEARDGKILRADVSRGVGQIVPTVLANLMLLHKARPKGARLVVAMERRKVTRYDRLGFRRLREVVNVMTDLGLIIKHPHDFKKKRTAIEARGKLKRTLMGKDLALGHIVRAEGEETIQVTARPVNKTVGRKRLANVWVDYKDTQESKRLRKELDQINSFLSSRSITLRGDSMPSFRLVRRFGLRREDDPLRFDLHGRLYGGFWMTLKATDRPYLRIDGEPIADLDFASMFPRLAYLKVGKEPPEGDLYAIRGLENHRDGAKAAISALLSYRRDMQRLPDRVREKLPKGWTTRQLKAAVAEKHPELVPLFGKDLGLDLMFTESRILIATLQRLMAEDVPALPMHDGIMVPRSKAETARMAMEEASEGLTGDRLPISRKQM